MKRKTLFITVFLLVFASVFSNCKEKQDKIENELATIFFTEFQICTNGVDSLGFFIEDGKPCLFPYCGQVPLEYRETGLKVRISGTMIVDSILDIYAPNAFLSPSYIFNLTSIERAE